jgi:taurine dioxygenase
MAKAELDIAPPGDGIPFGAMVSGLTQVQLRDESVRRALLDLWIEQGVILFRGGEATSEMHVELSRCFGELEPHPFPESTEPGFPDLVKIKFYPEDGTYYDVGGEQRGGWLPWHSDLIYTDRINRGGILRPVQLPQNLGMTGFIDQIAAWERLPARLKDKIEGLHVVYAVDMDFSRQLFAQDGNVRCLRMAASGTAIARRMWTYPRVTHPMVFEQAETGRKVLNVSPGFAQGILEMGGPDGDALLREVIAHCTDPACAWFHDWRDGDMVLWDNWRVLHCATGVPPDQTRVMQRTTIRGDYALGRKLDGAAQGMVSPDFDV